MAFENVGQVIHHPGKRKGSSTGWIGKQLKNSSRDRRNLETAQSNLKGLILRKKEHYDKAKWKLVERR